MNNREKFKAVLHFEKVDRVPNVEIGYWYELSCDGKRRGCRMISLSARQQETKDIPETAGN